MNKNYIFLKIERVPNFYGSFLFDNKHVLSIDMRKKAFFLSYKISIRISFAV